MNGDADPLAPLPAGLARRLAGAALERAVAARWRFQQRRTRRVDLTRGGPERLVVLPGVFHPDLYFTSWPLALAAAAWVRERGGAPRVLDLGTGAGPSAILAARAGAQVTAVDLDPRAVRCARLNTALCGLAAQVRAQVGDLFAPVAGERFDLVVFNPPFLEGALRPGSGQAPGPAELAFRGGPRLALLARFVREAPDHLVPGGEALLALSTRADLQAAREHLAAWSLRLAAQRDLVFERVLILAARPPIAFPGPSGYH